MLQFFRKYQRFFFLIITFVVIISFSFFGTQFNLDSKKVEDKKISQTISGKPITLRQVRLLSNFLNSKWDDQNDPNLFNDDILTNDILKSGFAKKLVVTYFDNIKCDLEKSFIKTKNFKPYSHPKYPFLSSENIWSQFSPKMLEQYRELRTHSEFTLEAFKCMSQLFMEENEFPPYLLKSILLNTQQRQSWIEPDPTLIHKNLALFGFSRPSEWFGRQFLDLVAQFILNVSSMSSEKGYDVSFQEAKIDLHKNFISSLKRRKEFDEKQLTPFFSYQLKRLNMSETDAVNLWRHVLSFRKYFQSITNSMILDLEIWPFKITKAQINSYKLPNYLKFNTFLDVLKLDLYISAVSDAKTTSSKLDLPQSYLSAENIKDTYPELVEAKFKVIQKAVSKEKLKAKIAVKDVWHWQLRDENWSKLKDKFSFINAEIATHDARFEKLKALSASEQNIADDFARDEILKEDESYLTNSLNSSEEQEMIIGISKNRLTKDLSGIDNPANLKNFFLSCSSETFSRPYSDNQRVYYQFKVIESSKEDEVMSFERAKETKAIDIALERFLEGKYPKIRDTDPARFKDADGNFKPFNQVIDDVGLIAFQEIYDELKENFSNYHKKGQSPIQFFTAARLIPYMEKIYSSRDHDLNSFINDELKLETTPYNQWKLIKEDKYLHSKEVKDDFLATAFEMSEKKFSELGFYENTPIFFQLMSKSCQIDQEALENKKNAISNELLDDLADKIIDKMIAKDVVCFLGE